MQVASVFEKICDALVRVRPGPIISDRHGRTAEHVGTLDPQAPGPGPLHRDWQDPLDTENRKKKKKSLAPPPARNALAASHIRTA